MNEQLRTLSGKEPLKTLSANVTDELIRESKPCNHNRCMVAEAIQRKYLKATHIFVDTAAIRFTLDGVRYYFIPPQNVKDFIAKFDRKERVEPFKFMASFRARVRRAGDSPYRVRTNRTGIARPSAKKRMVRKIRVNGVCHLEKVA